MTAWLPGAGLARRTHYQGSPWTDARRALLAETWPAGVPRRVIRQRLAALPGEALPKSPRALNAYARWMGLRRPGGRLRGGGLDASAAGAVVTDSTPPVVAVELSDATLERLAAMIVQRMAEMRRRPRHAADDKPKPQTWTDERRTLFAEMWAAGELARNIWPHLAALPGPPMPGLGALRAYGHINFGGRGGRIVKGKRVPA